MSVLALIGCGFLGGSFALASKRHGCFDTVLGRDIDHAVEVQAIELGIIEGTLESTKAIDAVCIAVPTHAIAATVQELSREIDVITPMFDVGSVKTSVLRELNKVPPNFVPCHPIAGSHKSGPTAARPELFDGGVCVLTPTCVTTSGALEKVASWWRQIGSTVLTMSASSHDEAVATTSHLPHLVSCAAVALLMDNEFSASDLIGNGYKDFSRIAAGDATMWRSIFVDNLDNLRVSFRDLSTQIERMLALAEADLDELERGLRHIATFRESLNGE